MLLLINFKGGILVKKENPPGTSFDPSGSQSGNQGRVNFIISYKQNIEESKQIHNLNFLINPTMNLFPLSSQSRNRGVSIMITLKCEIWSMELIERSSILPCKSDKF